MRDLLKKMKPDCFEDIVALLGFVPSRSAGSRAWWTTYIKCKHGTEKVQKYELPQLEGRYLKETHGVILYQEQVMNIASALAGLHTGRRGPAAPRNGEEESLRRWRRSKGKNSCKGSAQKNDIPRERRRNAFST